MIFGKDNEMKGLAEYIEKELSSVEYNKILIKFQRSVLEDGNEIEKRTRRAGLPDEGVLLDLVKSLHPDLKKEYEVFRKEEIKRNREKLMHKILLIGTPIYFLLMVAAYLAVSFKTSNWAQTWLIIIACVTFWLDTVGVALTAEIASKRKLFHPIARVLLALAVMMTAVCVFLFGNTLFAIPRFWVVVPGGVMVALLVDAIFAYSTRQLLRNVNYIIYIVFEAAMLYVVLGGLYVIPWSPGWLMIPLSLLIDVAYVLIRLIINSKYTYKPEGDI